jgi:hypothetical protein
MRWFPNRRSGDNPMSKKILSGLPALLVLMLNVPCFAQNEITENQPVVGDVNSRHAQVQNKLKSDFDQGLIDSDQLSLFQRDLDGIGVQEDELKSKDSGLTGPGRDAILKKLDQLEARLDKQAKRTTK